MKYLCLFLLLSFASCVNGQKTYMCGERACIDKKEFKQYFAENLIVEIQTIKDKKKTSVDLVKLNRHNMLCLVLKTTITRSYSPLFATNCHAQGSIIATNCHELPR